MAEDNLKTGAKVNGVDTHTARVQLDGGHQSGQGLATSTGRLQDATRDENNPSSSKKRTFKSVVQHHFVKDKLFVLVNELLKSAEEERRAHEELIASFQTAREVTGPIGRQALSDASHRTKRRRKRADTPLIERIEQTRKESREQLECIEIYKKNAAAVGHMKITASEVKESKCEDFTEIADESEHDIVKNKMKPNRFTEDVETKNDTKNDSVNCKENVDLEENDQPKTRRRSKSLPAGETEKLSAIYDLHRDENTSEVDRLILDSLLHDNDKFETPDSGQQKQENNMEKGTDDTAKKDDESSSDVTVAVESNTESDEDEANVKVIGSNDEIEEGESGDDTDLRNEDEIEKVKDSNISTSDFTRIPASLHPTLGTIAEASSESFQTLPSSARDSSSIIEIEAKKSKLPWRADNSVPVYNDAVKTDTSKNGDNGNTKGSSSSGDPSDKVDVRKDIWVIGSDGNESSNVHNKIKREKTVKDSKRPKSVHYEHSGRLYDENIYCQEKNNSKVKPERHSNKSPKSRSKKKKEHEIERSKSELELKHKSKSTRRISLDLLDVYEENTDLQRVSMSEIKPSKQHLGRKGKSSHSPKRSRSKSPTKKRSSETKKNDMKTLPPNITSSSNSNDRNNPFLTLYRSKTELSPRVSSSGSFDDKTTSCKTLQNLKDERRYRKPDFVLWERLDISEGCPKDKKNGLQWSDDYDFEANHRYSGLTENNARQHGGTDGRRVTWNVPLNEAIKKLTGSKNVPDISKISHSVPREERIGRLYIDLKQERRASGSTEYRRLDTPDRKEDIDEFTHL